MKKYILYLLLGLLTACTDFQVFAPISPKGNRGERGTSAYEMWLFHLDKGLYPDWEGGRTEIDYMKFLTGADGKDGMETYKVWKEMISKGDVKDPYHPEKTWLREKNSVRDFFWFLMGEKNIEEDKKDERDEVAPSDPNVKAPNDLDAPNEKKNKKGRNGITAYEIWKKEVEKGTLPNPHPLFPEYSGQFWRKDKVTEKDFRVYLNGRDAVIQPEIRVKGIRVTTEPSDTNPTHLKITDARPQTMIITIVAPVGVPKLELHPADKPTEVGEKEFLEKYHSSLIDTEEKNGVKTYIYELNTPHNIGPEYSFNLEISNALNEKQPHHISVTQKGYLTPLEYVAEFNLNKIGDKFAPTHANADSGLFKLKEAIKRYSVSAKFVIDGVRYYMPDIYTWRSIFPSDDEGMTFNREIISDNKKEPMLLNTHSIKEVFTADYRSADGKGYGLRLKSKDNRLRTAFRYEYIDNPVPEKEKKHPLDKALKVTSRFLGPDKPGATITIATITDETFWGKNNEHDVVRIFPASGILDDSGKPVKDKYGESGYYWSTDVWKDKSYGYRMLFHQYAVDASDVANPAGYSSAVRLFRRF